MCGRLLTGDMDYSFATSSISRGLLGPLSGLRPAKAEEAAWNFRILEIVQATFYVMVVNDALKSALADFQWYTFEM